MVKRAQEYLGSDWERFNTLFREEIRSDIQLLEIINGYLLQRSGKQLRPLLCLLAARACTGAGVGVGDGALRCAVASEMIHTASLLHDDVADAADLRRGSPTVRALFSPTTSVLAGDYWLSRAIRTIIGHVDQYVIKSFAKCLEDLAEGEMIQLQKADSLDTTYDDYVAIIKRKTASLFQTAMTTGAVASGAVPEQVEAIEGYALHLGIAFQMRDDILDYSPAFETGKSAGQDLVERKITLPLLGALENNPSRADEVREFVREGNVDEVLHYVGENDGIGYAQKVLEEEAERASAALDVLESSEAVDILRGLASHLCMRKS